VGSKQDQYPSLFPDDPDDFVSIFGAAIKWESIGVFMLVLVITGLLFLVFNKTKFGLSMRAVASNVESAKLVGIRTNQVLMMSWGLAAAIGAIGGVVFAGINNNVNLGLMFTVFIYGSAAATLGGFDSPGGAVIGGLAIGVIENLASGYFPEWVGQEMKVAVAFIVIIVVLLFKPSGLFGTAKVERV
jgi:branched-chain amino acid transport system permease protein